MNWLRLLIVLLVGLCPPQIGARIAEGAERAEEHHEVDPAAELWETMTHRRVVQPPTPSSTTRAARRCRQALLRLSGGLPAPRRRTRPARRDPRLLLFSDGDDPDPGC